MHEVKFTLRDLIEKHGKKQMEEVLFIEDNLEQMPNTAKVNMIFHNSLAQGIENVTVEKVQLAQRHYQELKARRRGL
jgi:hypothetical protein